ncbi:MAG: alpha/beta fold hydrolase [Acidimicrobiia bacterium]|nr:alpha/beta fold hydrolase [Acidimicrobiia bacterium]
MVRALRPARRRGPQPPRGWRPCPGGQRPRRQRARWAGRAWAAPCRGHGRAGRTSAQPRRRDLIARRRGRVRRPRGQRRPGPSASRRPAPHPLPRLRARRPRLRLLHRARGRPSRADLAGAPAAARHRHGHHSRQPLRAAGDERQDRSPRPAAPLCRARCRPHARERGRGGADGHAEPHLPGLRRGRSRHPRRSLRTSRPRSRHAGGVSRRLVLVHGFAQTARCWGPLAADLGRDLDVVAVDLPGHGASPSPACDLRGAAALVGEAGGRATYLGYSFGGRVCLRLALDRPDLVERLVLVGATAGLEDQASRAERCAADEALAQQLEAEGVAAFLDRWLGLPLFAGVPERHQYREERMRNTAAGLAASLRLAGTGAQEPLWGRLRELGESRLEVLAVAGGRDAKFAAAAQRLALGIGPTAEVALVEGAGHTAHLEQPERFLVLLRGWLARHG